jgi:hypothetical protein
MAANSKTKLLNIIGLSFGLMGVLIIFSYGPPQPSFFPYDIITDDNIHQEILDMRDKYDLCSKIGLGFIFFGFLLQLLAVIFSGNSIKRVKVKIEETKNNQNTDTKDSIKK